MFLLSRDTVNGAEGKIIVTVNGKQTEIAGMRNITANAEIQGQDMRVIGTRVIQNKPTGAKQPGTGNIYYGSNIFLDMVLEYINTGHMPEFDIQISNTDPTTSIGSQVMAFYGCQLTGTIPLSVLNNEESMLNYDFNFTFTRVARLASFTEPSSYGS